MSLVVSSEAASGCDLRYIADLLRHGADLFAVTPDRRNAFTISNHARWMIALKQDIPQISVEYLRTSSPSGGHLLAFLQNVQLIGLLTNMQNQRDWDLLGEPKLLEKLLTSSAELSSVVVKYICSLTGPVGTGYAVAALPFLCASLRRFPINSFRADVMSIIQCCGSDIDQVSSSGLSSLMHACAAGEFQIISALLARGADPCRQGPCGETSLLLLAQWPVWTLPAAEETANELVAAVARSSQKSLVLEAQDDKGRTVANLCIENENTKLLRAVMGATEWSLTEPSRIVDVLAASVSRTRSLGAVLEHLKQVLSGGDFEHSMRLVLDMKEGLNIREKSCAISNPDSVKKILSLASTAYSDDLLAAVRAVEPEQWQLRSNFAFALSKNSMGKSGDTAASPASQAPFQNTTKPPTTANGFSFGSPSATAWPAQPLGEFKFSFTPGK